MKSWQNNLLVLSIFFASSTALASDLSGYCPDRNHKQFQQAKDFAYSPSGLNYTSQRAINWALDYNQTHRCGTIQEYKARFEELFSYAYSPSYLNMTPSNARIYALNYVEYTYVETVQYWKYQFTDVHELFYSPYYFNNTYSISVIASREWVERGNCEDRPDLNRIKDRYRREYDFAYSPNGLNYTAARAKQYALERVVPMSYCGDLFR